MTQMKRWIQLIKEWQTRPLGDILAEQFKRFLVWWKTTTPNPWPEELDEALKSTDAKLLCSHCFTPQRKGSWFCPKCGAAVGPYNNIMPYLNIFSTGEMLRAGAGSKLKRTPLTIIGYVMVSLMEYLIFAPVFLYRFVRNWKRQKEAVETEDAESEDSSLL